MVYRDIFKSLFHSEIEVILSPRDGYKDTDGLLRRIIKDEEEKFVKVIVGETKKDKVLGSIVVSYNGNKEGPKKHGANHLIS